LPIKLILFAFQVILDIKAVFCYCFQLIKVLNYPAKALLCITLHWWNED